MTVPLEELFTIVYGNKLDWNKMAPSSKADGGVNFIGRSSQNNGLAGVVAPVHSSQPFPPGCISVALGGTLASFVQLEPFYTAQNVAVLKSRESMSIAEKLYICLCIQHNRFRYSPFGREANRTLRTLPVPSRDEFPAWVGNADLSILKEDHSLASQASSSAALATDRWGNFLLSELFRIRKGVRLTQANIKPGNTAFISAIDSNNGLRERISAAPLHPAGLITVNYNGNGVAEAFYQPEPFFASDDVNVLYPLFSLDAYIALFICTIIRREKYRFSYGRKWTLDRMNDTQIRLPALPDGSPDWTEMRTLIRSLPYSSRIGLTVPAEA